MRRKRSLLVSSKSAKMPDGDEMAPKTLEFPEVTVSLRRYTPEEIEELCQKFIDEAKSRKKVNRNVEQDDESESDPESLSDAESSSSHSDVDSYKLRGIKISVYKTEKKRYRKKRTPEKNFSSDSELEAFADKYKLRKIKFSALRQFEKRGAALKSSLYEGSDMSDLDKKTLRRLRKAAARKAARKTGDDVNFSSDSETYGFRKCIKNIKESAVNKAWKRKEKKRKHKISKKYYISSDEDQDAKVDKSVAKRSRRSGRTERIYYKEKRLSSLLGSESDE